MKVLIGVAATLAVAVALFDWNWFRAPLERYLRETSGREVRIGDLHLTVGLEPTVRVRDVYVQNAPWADAKPMMVAREASFTFSLKSLWDERTVVSRIVLIDADVDLERQADGLRNWRLREPEYRGPPKVKVLALEAHDTRLRFVNRATELDLAMAASALAPGEGGRDVASGMTNRIDFSGSFRGAKFSGTTRTGELVTLRETGKSVPLAGHLEVGRTRMDVDGSVADILDISALDAKVRLAGPSLAGVHPFLKLHPPATRPYLLDAKVRLVDGEYAFTGLVGKIGNTDVAGEGGYRRDSPDRPRSMLRAALRSNSADLADFMPAAGGGAPTDAQRLLPAGKLGFERLRDADANVTLEVKKLTARNFLALESLRITGKLEDGVLQFKPIDLGIAGGHAVGTVTADARGTSLTSRAAVDFRAVRLERLFSTAPAAARSTGLVEARLELAGQGDSLAAIFGSSSGTFTATVGHGRMSNLTDAKLALNGGKILALKIRGDQDIDIRCGAISIDFKNGTGSSRTIMLDTEQTRTDGAGTVDLRAETLDALLTPKPKKPGLFALGASIHVHGPWRHPEIAIDKRAIEAGPGADGPCAKILGSAR